MMRDESLPNSEWIYTYAYAPDEIWEPWREKIEIEDWIGAEADRVANEIDGNQESGVLAIALLTDTHFNVNGTWSDTLKALCELNNRVHFDGIVHLGDFTDGMVSAEKTKAYAGDVISDLKSLNVPLHVCLGNHDSNYFRNNPERLSVGEQRELYLAGKESHYYIEYAEQKLKLVFLDSFDAGEALRYGYTDECINFLSETLEEMPDDWQAVIFSHLPPLAKLQYWVKEIRGEAELMKVLREHSNKIIAFITGHNHADRLYNEEAFPIISIANAKCEAYLERKTEGFITPPRRLGERTQECFDIMLINSLKRTIKFVRFGSGQNRMVENEKARWQYKTKIYGHRGAFHFAPENTLTSFQTALDMGVDGVEFDIQLSKDGEVVVCHDETLDRTSTGNGNLRDYTLQELRYFNFNKRGISEPKYMPIPTLREVLELLKSTNSDINIELKTGIYYYEGIEKKAYEIVKEMELLNRVVWSSFNHCSVQRIKQLDPSARTAFLCGGGILTSPEECKSAGAEALHIQLNQLDYPGLVDSCRQHGIKLRVWTVNEYADIERAYQLGIDGIFTNRIDVARAVKEGTR